MGRLWLSQRSTEPRLQGAVKMPAELGPKPWQSAGERYAIASVVIGAFIPESEAAMIAFAAVLVLVLFGAELRRHFGLGLDAIIAAAAIW